MSNCHRVGDLVSSYAAGKQWVNGNRALFDHVPTDLTYFWG
jgi:hypothetical protein